HSTHKTRSTEIARLSASLTGISAGAPDWPGRGRRVEIGGARFAIGRAERYLGGPASEPCGTIAARAFQRQEVESVGSIGRIPVLLSIAAALLVPGRLEAQSAHEREAYFRAVAEYFALPPDEVAILGSWDLPPDEIPVVLFVAARAGVSPEALTALRESGASWASLASRYRIGAAQLHVPLSRSPDGGALAETYRRYAATPAG